MYLSVEERERMKSALISHYADYYVAQKQKDFVPVQSTEAASPMPDGIFLRESAPGAGVPAAPTVFNDAAAYQDGVQEFYAVWPQWCNLAEQIDWVKTFPVELKGKVLRDLDFFEDLLHLDIGNLYTKLEVGKTPHPVYGYMFSMAETHMGRSLASSLPERINSAAALILTEGRTLLKDHHLEMCTILRINKKFVRYMKKKHPEIATQLIGKHMANLASKKSKKN
jgi:hypothetical protein